MSSLLEMFDQQYGDKVTAPKPEPTEPNPDATLTSAVKPPDFFPTGGETNTAQDGGMKDVLVDTLVNGLIPGGQAIDFLNQKIKDGDTSSKEALAAAALDSATLGTADSHAGVKRVLKDTLKGELNPFDVNEMLATYQDERSAFNTGVSDLRSEHRAASFGGDILGSLAPGAAFYKGAMSMFKNGAKLIGTYTGVGRTPFWRSFVAAPAVAGGTEAGLYRANSDGTLGEVALDASIGGIGGAVLGAFTGGLQTALIGRLRPSNSALNEKVGMELFNATQPKVSKELGRVATPEDVLKYIQEKGPDTVLADVFPELRNKMQVLATAPEARVREPIIRLLSTRGDFQTTYRDTILNEISEGGVRSPTRFDNYATGAQKALSTKYDDVFDAANADGMAWKVRDVNAAIGRVLDRNIDGAAKDLETVKKLIRDTMNTKSISGSGRNRKTEAVGTLRQLAEAKKQIQKKIKERLVYNNKEGTSPLPIENLKRAQDYLRDILNQHQPYADLNARYGELGDAKSAYKVGMKIMSGRNFDDADVAMFLQGQKSEEAAKALIEGAKYQLLTNARNTGSNTALENVVLKDANLDKLSQLVGTDAVEQLRSTVKNMKGMRKTIEAADKGLEKAVLQGPLTRPNAVQTLLDNSIIMQALSGKASGVGPAFAARRQAAGIASGAPSTGKSASRYDQRLLEAMLDQTNLAEAMGAIRDPNRGTAAATGILSGVLGEEMASGIATGRQEMEDYFKQ